LYAKIFIKDEGLDLKNKVFITGFQGIGFAGYIAVSHMIKQTKAEPIGYLITDLLPPVVSMNGTAISLPYTFYAANDLLFLLPEAVPEQRERGTLFRKLSYWLKSSGIREAVLIGGLVNEFKKDENDLARVAYTSKYDASSKSAIMPPTIEKGLMIVGPIATLLSLFEALGLPAISILSYVDPNRPDPMGAANAIKVFNNMYGKEISTEELERDARKIEQEISEEEKKKMTEGGTSDQHRALYV